MQDSGQGAFRRVLLRLGLTALLLAALFVVLPALLSLIIPFVIAFAVAAVLNPLVGTVTRKTRLSRKAVALILDLLVFSILFSLLSLLVYTLVNEAMSLASNVQSGWDSVMAGFGVVEEKFTWLAGVLPEELAGMFAGFQDSVLDWLQTASAGLLNSLVSAMTSLTATTGNLAIGLIVSILAVYFLIVDYNTITSFVKRCAGKRGSAYLSMLKRAVASALGGYLKSQLLLALFAFAVMFTAFVIYGQDYALLLALLLSLVDFVPILGTIAVLLPWGVVELLTGSFNKGVFLVVLGVGFFVARKVVEPNIVGSQTGLHPLAALVSTYVGLKLFSIWGAVLGPIILMLAISVARSGIFDSTVDDLKLLAGRIAYTLRRE